MHVLCLARDNHRFLKKPLGFFKTFGCVLTLFILCTFPCQAQVTVDGSLGGDPGAVGPGTLPNGQTLFNGATTTDHLITHDLGKTIDNNLFHSFSEFSVEEGKSATFTGPDSIDNILSRVTGSTASQIDGILASTINNANFYLLNLNGVIFGENAKLDIKGAFYASNADFIRLGENERFYASLSENSVLTSASPEAFGFLGSTPPVINSIGQTTIKVEGLTVANGGAVTFVGRDAMAGAETVEGIIVRGGTLTHVNGNVNLVSIGSAQASEVEYVSVNVGTLGINALGESTQDPASLGHITINQGAKIDTSGTSGGTVMIRGGDLTIEDARISANITDALTDDSTAVTGEGIDIDVTNDVLIAGGSGLETKVTESAPQGVGSGGVRLNAGQLELLGDPEAPIDDRTGIRSDVAQNSLGGRSGDIGLNTNSARVRGAVVQTSGDGSADGGSIILNVKDNLELQESALIVSLTFGLGMAGDINIHVEDEQLSIRGGNITAQSVSGGGGGNINVTVGQEVLSGEIMTFEGGDILLDAGGSIFTTSFLSGEEGRNIQIKARNLELRNGGDINVQSVFSPISDQPSGNLTIDLTGNLSMNGAGSGIGEQNEITVISRGGSPSGGAMITAKDIIIGEFSSISTQSQNEGRGGDLRIRADNLLITDGGSVTSSSGNPFFIPGFFPPPTSIGDAGNILVDSNRPIVVNNGGEIVANTSSGGNGGTINLSASDISVTSNSRVAAESFSTAPDAGNAGNIALTARETISISDSIVTTKAENALGGNIKLTANDLIQVTNSDIASQVLEGSDSAGKIDIDPDFVVIQNSNILSTAVSGDGGPITITANSAVLIDPTSTLDASSQFGGSGTIDIQAPIQQLSEAIAPLPEDIVKAGALYAEACASQKGGQFSSLVKNTDSTISPILGGFLSSPLAFKAIDTSQPTTHASVTSEANPIDPPSLQQWLGQMAWTFSELNLSATPIQIQACSIDKG